MLPHHAKPRGQPGRQVPPDSGSPGAISLRDYNIARVNGCTPASAVSPRPTGFTLPTVDMVFTVAGDLSVQTM